MLIALAVPWIRQISVWKRALMSWVGLAGILLAPLLYTSGTPFPGDAALLPVLSAALVVAGGVRPGPARGAVSLLQRPEFQLTGNLSYSLYLWHWPILVIAAEAVGHSLSLRREPAADRLRLRAQLRDVQALRGPDPPRAGAAMHRGCRSTSGRRASARCLRPPS